ncbi:MAG: hypothetical protein ABIO67_07115 [Mycobacteriales bacterium]
MAHQRDVTRHLARWPAPLIYLLLSVIGHLPAFRSLTTMTQCTCRDAPQTDWFLAWTPYALGRGWSPVQTIHLNAPDGINLMWNTLLPLPGLLMAPVTVWGNVLATHTVLAVLAFALSATTMWWVVARWAPWPPARFAAGLLYGFSPYLVAQGLDHLNLSLVALPPLVLLLLDELLVRQRRRAVLSGALLGLVALAQLLTSEEVLASTFLICVAGLVVLFVQQRRVLTRGRVRHAVVGLGTAAGLLTLLAAPALAVQMFGARRVTGSVTTVGDYGADLLGIVVPGPRQLFGFHGIESWGGGSTENGSYLGLPLLLLLIWITWRYRRLGVVRWAGVLAVTAWVLSLGRSLAVAGAGVGVPLPARLWGGLPLLQDLVNVRLSLYVAAFAAVLLAVGLDRLRVDGALRRHPRRVAFITLVVVVSLLPAWPYSYQKAEVPDYFTSSEVLRIPRDALVLTYPVPRFPSSEPMLWQALARYRYRSVGGYVITPDAEGHGTFQGGVTAWERAVAPAAVGRPIPLGNTATSMLVRLELAQLQVRAIVVADRPGAPDVVALVTQLLGRPGERTGGVTVWYLDAPAAL